VTSPPRAKPEENKNAKEEKNMKTVPVRFPQEIEKKIKRKPN
jgi:hypothetical protein